MFILSHSDYQVISSDRFFMAFFQKKVHVKKGERANQTHATVGVAGTKGQKIMRLIFKMYARQIKNIVKLRVFFKNSEACRLKIKEIKYYCIDFMINAWVAHWIGMVSGKRIQYGLNCAPGQANYFYCSCWELPMYVENWLYSSNSCQEEK